MSTVEMLNKKIEQLSIKERRDFIKNYLSQCLPLT